MKDNEELEKEGVDQLEKLNEASKNLSAFLDSAMTNAFNVIESELDDKQKIQYNAFLNKYTKLFMKGDFKAAEELKKKFSE